MTARPRTDWGWGGFLWGWRWGGVLRGRIEVKEEVMRCQVEQT